MKKEIYIIFITILISSNIWAISGMQSLNLPVGARPIAMGGAFIAESSDINALFWNQAGLAYLKDISIIINYTELFEGMKYTSVGSVLPHVFPIKGNIGVSILFFSDFSIIRTVTDNSQPLGYREEGEFEIYDLLFQISYGQRLKKNVLVGGSFKYAYEKLDTYTSSPTIVLDLTAKLEQLNGFDLGAGIKNIGISSKIIQERIPLPISIFFGVSRKVQLITEDFLTLIDINYRPVDKIVILSGGVEYKLKSLEKIKRYDIKLRIGYSYLKNDLGFLSGLRAGMGFSVYGLNIDYAMAPAI